MLPDMILDPQALKRDDLRNGLFTVSLGSGASRNLTINTGRLIAKNGALASTFSLRADLETPAAGRESVRGNLSVTTPAAGSVELVDPGSIAGTAGNRRAGDLTINTGRLIIQGGGVAATTTLNQG